MAIETVYVVQKGDSLWSIVRKKYNITDNTAISRKVNEIVEWNKSTISNPSIICVGEKIILKDVPGETASTPSSDSSAVNYRATVTNVGLVVGTERDLKATWRCNNENIDHYEVRWWWSTGGSDATLGEEGTVKADFTHDTYTAPQNAERAWFHVKPISKTYKSGDKDVSYWTADWSEGVAYYFKDNPPKVPSTPTVDIKNGEITITLENVDVNGTHIEFEIIQDNDITWITELIPITYGSVSYTSYINNGSDYKVRARSVRDDLRSDWSAYSSEVGTGPAASGGITTCRAASTTSVYLAWEKVANADSYDIEYTTKLEYFDGSDNTTTKTGIETTSYTLTGLESGTEYFFRVRAVNTKGHSSWSDYKSLVLGKKPAAPTTWSSTTTAITGESLILYWVHNSEDGSKQTCAELELTINGYTNTLTIPKTTAEDEEEKTSSYSFDTSPYVAGTSLKWRVRTCGVTGEYGDWSIERKVDIYARPTLILRLTDTSGNYITTLSEFPINVTGIAGPNTQTPVSYHLTVISNETYTTIDHIGNEQIVMAGEEIYSKYFDISTSLSTMLSANDIDLHNTISYTVNCIVCMDSGLTAEAKSSFKVSWDELLCEPNAEIGISDETYTAIIRPYCKDANRKLIEDVTLSVYRREFNGSFTEIVKGLSNTDYAFATDPHPSLDYARYRIVAIHNQTGAVSFCDLAGVPMGVTCAVLQWNEKWTDFNLVDDYPTKESWTGSMLKLHGNIDVTNSHSIDTSLVEYIGRNHPVSYYGTQLGETATWSMDIPKKDKETLYALRRLAAWTGDVYVREPSGSGYWANVAVSFSQKHRDVVIPVTLDIKRVEGGM